MLRKTSQHWTGPDLSSWISELLENLTNCIYLTLNLLGYNITVSFLILFSRSYQIVIIIIPYCCFNLAFNQNSILTYYKFQIQLFKALLLIIFYLKKENRFSWWMMDMETDEYPPGIPENEIR